MVNLDDCGERWGRGSTHKRAELGDDFFFDFCGNFLLIFLFGGRGQVDEMVALRLSESVAINRPREPFAVVVVRAPFPPFDKVVFWVVREENNGKCMW